MLMVGAGRLSLNLIEAHACVRPISHVTIWARDRRKAEATAAQLVLDGIEVPSPRIWKPRRVRPT